MSIIAPTRKKRGERQNRWHALLGADAPRQSRDRRGKTRVSLAVEQSRPCRAPTAGGDAGRRIAVRSRSYDPPDQSRVRKRGGRRRGNIRAGESRRRDRRWTQPHPVTIPRRTAASRRRCVLETDRDSPRRTAGRLHTNDTRHRRQRWYHVGHRRRTIHRLDREPISDRRYRFVGHQKRRATCRDVGHPPRPPHGRIRPPEPDTESGRAAAFVAAFGSGRSVLRHDHPAG